jgi:hypothetical protein
MARLLLQLWNNSIDSKKMQKVMISLSFNKIILPS